MSYVHFNPRKKYQRHNRQQTESGGNTGAPLSAHFWYLTKTSQKNTMNANDLRKLACFRARIAQNKRKRDNPSAPDHNGHNGNTRHGDKSANQVPTIGGQVRDSNRPLYGPPKTSLKDLFQPPPQNPLGNDPRFGNRDLPPSGPAPSIPLKHLFPSAPTANPLPTGSSTPAYPVVGPPPPPPSNCPNYHPDYSIPNKLSQADIVRSITAYVNSKGYHHDPDGFQAVAGSHRPCPRETSPEYTTRNYTYTRHY